MANENEEDVSSRVENSHSLAAKEYRVTLDVGGSRRSPSSLFARVKIRNIGKMIFVFLLVRIWAALSCNESIKLSVES